jgi:hypothetical protein
LKPLRRDTAVTPLPSQPIDRPRRRSIDRKAHDQAHDQHHEAGGNGYFSRAIEQKPSPPARNYGNAEIELSRCAARGACGRSLGASTVSLGVLFARRASRRGSDGAIP